jgi:hypothetical protein
MKRRLTHITGGLLAAAALVWACSDGGTAPTPVPTTIELNETSISFDAVGATDQLTATVRDQNGNIMSSQTVGWSSNATSVATVSDLGLVTSAGNGNATITASAGSASATVSVTVAQVPAQVQKVSGDAQTGIVVQTLNDPLVVQVNDSEGTPIQGVTVSFAVSMNGGSVNPTSGATGATGQTQTDWTLGSTTGGHSVTATPGSGSGSASFTATAFQPGTPASAEKLEGDGQAGLVGFAVNIQPAMLVKDGAGSPLPGINVTFSVSGGGGTVAGGASSMVATDASGIARAVDWELGASPATNTLDADVAGTGITGDPATFTASGVNSSYDIEIVFLGTNWTSPTMAPFTSAEGTWETLIIGELPDVNFSSSPVAAGACGVPHPEINDVVDDLRLYAVLDSIDGPFGVLGAAGPCLVRTTGQLTVVGIMRFDSADVGLSVFPQVVLHEMAHAIGVGALWDNLGFLVNPSLPSSPGVDTYFSGPRANAEFDALGGDDYVAGDSVPVENTAALGQADGHWRETVLGLELMTPFVTSGMTNPLSRITTASLWDLGYQVNLAGSQAYTVPPAPPAMAGFQRIDLGDDLWRGPLYGVDPTGRVVRQIR